MKDLLQYILDNILEGEHAQVSEDEQDGVVIMTVSAPADMVGKIIGKGGKTINSVKNILKIRAVKENKRVDIQVKELA